MNITAETLAAATGCDIARARLWLVAINAAMAKYDINTPARQAAFLAQIGHESGGLRYSTEIWGPTPAQARYEGRADLGNNQPGDGSRYRGRGLIQITGRANYAACSTALYGYPSKLLTSPRALAEPEAAALSAAWFWNSHGCDRYADAGDFDGVSDVINRGRKTVKEGDANGYADRLSRWVKAKVALGV